MPSENSNYSPSASDYWRANQPLEAGRLIFESLPKEARLGWAKFILESVIKRTGVSADAIDNILNIARCPSEWRKAHDAFSRARRHALELSDLKDRTPEQTLLLETLGLAELVAKVVYNVTNPVDEFDEDSGWWIAVCLKNILDLLQDEEFSTMMWRALCFQEQ